MASPKVVPQELRRGGRAIKKIPPKATKPKGTAGVVLVNRRIFLTNTTPAAATAPAFLSSAELGRGGELYGHSLRGSCDRFKCSSHLRIVSC